MVFVTVIERVFDHSQPARPWGELFKTGFAPPIRENWRYRLVINIVWFARNYLNIVVGAVLAVAYWYPGFLLTVAITLAVHTPSCKARPHTRTGLQVGQLLSMLLNNWLYGWLAGFTFSVAVAAVILLHAVFTPYTDERVKRYHECVDSTAEDSTDGKARSTVERFAPRTPVMSFAPSGQGNFPPVEPTDVADGGPAEEAAARLPPPLSIRPETTAAKLRRRRGVTQTGVAGGARAAPLASSMPTDFGAFGAQGSGLFPPATPPNSGILAPPGDLLNRRSPVVLEEEAPAGEDTSVET